MIGGTYKADYHPETGQFTPTLNKKAWFKIAYNYGCYYYEFHNEKGIRCIYGLCWMAIKERHTLTNVKVENSCCIHSEICI